MSPAVARQNLESLVPFPQNRVSVEMLKVFGLTAIQHALLDSCSQGIAVSSCTSAEVKMMRSLHYRGTPLVRSSKDERWWYVTGFGQMCLDMLALSMHSERHGRKAKILRFRA